MKKSSPIAHIIKDARDYTYMGTGSLTEAERNRYVIEHIGIIGPVAQKYRGGNFAFEDLLAVGREGLVRAAHSFNPKKGEFLPWALGTVDSAIYHYIRSLKSQWMPKETDGPVSPVDGDKIERVFEWDAWGDFGNSIAICEAWTVAGASPEDITIAYDLVKHRRDRFAAAFISLSSIQRKMVKACYLQEPKLTIESAARDIGISRYRASRSLKKALETMREVIKRADDNEKLRLTPASTERYASA